MRTHYRRPTTGVFPWLLVSALMSLAAATAGCSRSEEVGRGLEVARFRSGSPAPIFARTDCEKDIDCVRGAIAAAGDYGTVYFYRDSTYTFGAGDAISLRHVGLELRAEPGPGARPILRWTASIHGGHIEMWPNAKIIALDLRGPFENSVEDRVLSVTEPCATVNDCPQAYGINGSGSWKHHWAVDSTDVNGFWDNGIHMCESTGARITNSNVSYNGRSGIAAYCEGSTDLTIAKNVLSFNGQDGLDSSASNSEYRDNIASHNGWQGHAGDQNGILIVAGRAVEVTGNRTSRNLANGIYLNGTWGGVTDVRLVNNSHLENEELGVRFSGTLRQIEFIGDRSVGDRECWNLPFEGVSARELQCSTPVSEW